MSTPPLPSVAVLMATYNGRQWLPEQLQSILDQEGVQVTVTVLDDGSTDGTVDWLNETAAAEPRLTVLASDSPSGSAAANFFRLIDRAPTELADYVALSDQDDVWIPGKLARHIGLIVRGGFDGVSSSVLSFTPEGTKTLIRKNYRQRQFDYLLESPGPGCSFLMTPATVDLVRNVVRTDSSVSGIDFHDSLIYALARVHGLTWYIDGTPTVNYRQHGNNVMGANVGRGSALARLSLIRTHWHRNQAVLMGRVALGVASPAVKPALERVVGLMSTRGIRARFALVALSGQFRRRPRDRFVIGVLILLGVW